MITEQELDRFGFRSFVYPRHLRKDEYERKILIEYFGQNILHLRVVSIDDNWSLEKKDVSTITGVDSTIDLSGLTSVNDLKEFLGGLRNHYPLSDLNNE
jgi:hypothetical protein